MKKLFKKTKKGFTLVELLVVIAILAVLASVSVIGYLGFVEKARVSDDNTELHQIGTLVQAQLIDGSEEVFVLNGETSDDHNSHTSSSSTNCKAYTVYFVYAGNAVSAWSDEEHNTTWSDETGDGADKKTLLKAIIAMVDNESSEMAGYLTTATVTNGVLTLKYKNHAATESVWTLGTSETEE